MHRYPTRAERRQEKFYSLAKKGEVITHGVILYKREIIKLQKEGFHVYSIKPYMKSKDLYMATVSWDKAFGTAIPLMVSSYIDGIIETYPFNFVKNSAQELYIISKRVKNKN